MAGRRRYITTEMSLDKKLRDLAQEAGVIAVLLYTWMVPHADDDGIVKGDTEEILARVLPLWRWVPASDCEKALVSMESLGLIERSEDGNGVQFPAEKFYKYQSYIKPERRRTPQITAEHRKSLPRSSFVKVKDTLRENDAFSTKLIIQSLQSILMDTNGMHTTQATSYLDDLPPDVIIEAMQRAQNKRGGWNMAKSILGCWIGKGVKSMEDVARDDKDFTERKAGVKPLPVKVVLPTAEDIMRERGMEM